eukprot:jgi/Tetstr1/466884/TSEL_011339.t1
MAAVGLAALKLNVDLMALPAQPADMAPPSDGMPRYTGKPSGRSMFGHQADGRKQTFPAYSVPVGTRDTREKVFLTPEHVKTDKLCTTGPGPIYQTPIAIGKQVSSRNQTLPSYSLPRDARMQTKPHFAPGPGNYEMTSSLGKQTLHTKRSCSQTIMGKSTFQQMEKQFQSPGHMTMDLLRHSAPVGAYDIGSTLGKQASSRNQSLPSYSFGASKTSRFRSKQEEFASQMPGPGSHSTYYSMGKQAKSQFATAPKSSFGSSTRDIEGKRFLTAGHNSVRLGRAGEPAGYDPKMHASIGKQVSSMRRTGASSGFGTAKKMHTRVEYTPGPGAYDN